MLIAALAVLLATTAISCEKIPVLSESKGPGKGLYYITLLKNRPLRRRLPHGSFLFNYPSLSILYRGKVKWHDYTVFPMNPDGQVVGGTGYHVSRGQLAEMIDRLLEDADEDDRAATYVEVHDGSCSVRVG